MMNEVNSFYVENSFIRRKYSDNNWIISIVTKGELLKKKLKASIQKHHYIVNITQATKSSTMQVKEI